MAGSGWRAGGAAIVGALAVLGAAGRCAMKPDLPPMPAEVKLAVDNVDAAFAAAAGNAAGFRRAAAATLPALRRELDAWSAKTSGNEARGIIRGWMFEAGQIESGLSLLGPTPRPDECQPLVQAWRRLRGKMP